MGTLNSYPTTEHFNLLLRIAGYKIVIIMVIDLASKVNSRQASTSVPRLSDCTGRGSGREKQLLQSWPKVTDSHPMPPPYDLMGSPSLTRFSGLLSQPPPATHFLAPGLSLPVFIATATRAGPQHRFPLPHLFQRIK